MKTKLKIIIIIFLLIAIFIFEIYGDQTIYLPYRGNYQMTGVYNTKGVPVLHGIKWKIPIDVAHTPIVWNNNIYLTSGNCLYCIDPKTGNIIWKIEKQKIGIYPIISNNTIILSSEFGILRAIDITTKELKWKSNGSIDNRIITPPVVYKDIIFVQILVETEGTREMDYIAAIDIKTGKELYQYRPELKFQNDTISNPILYNGLIYYIKNNNLYCVDPERYDKEVFLFKVADNARYITIEDDCLIFGNIYLYAYDLKTKKLRWMFKKIFEDGSYSRFFNSFASVYNGKVFIGGNNFKKDGYIFNPNSILYAIDINDGKLLWQRDIGSSSVDSSFSIANDIIFIDNWGILFAIDCYNGNTIWEYVLPKNKPLWQSVLIYDGMIYFGCRDGYLYALY